MITGTRFFDDKERVYRKQNDNGIEGLLKRLKAQIKKHGVALQWLQSCMSNAAVICSKAVGYLTAVSCPGVYEPQEEDVLMNYFNEDRNKAKFQKELFLDPNLPPNRVMQYYPIAMKEVFNVECYYMNKFDGPFWDFIIKKIKEKNAIQLLLRKPSHSVAIFAFDDNTNELVGADPWERPSNNNDGWNFRLSKDDIENNVYPQCIIYHKKGIF